MELGERPRLFVVAKVLEHIEAQPTIERSIGKRQRRQRCGGHARRRVVGVDAADRQPVCVFVDEHAFTTAGVEHACLSRQRVEVAAHGRELREIGRIELPGGVKGTVVVPARRVLAAAYHLRASHRCEGL